VARISLLLLTTAVLAGSFAGSAASITGGTADGSAHPYAGALVVDGRVACSGVLVSPTVFLTAGHCVAAAPARVDVTFDAQLDPASWTLAPGTAHLDPAYGVDKKDSHDLAAVVLDRPVSVTPAELPSLGLLDAAQPAALTSVGYGYFDTKPFVYDGLRRNAVSNVTKLATSLVYSSTKSGGVCFGDSGGPQLLGDTVTALTSTGNKQCTGQSASYRLDTPVARAFLAGYLTLP
jgi:V8-like Glu-specific endopeptidase